MELDEADAGTCGGAWFDERIRRLTDDLTRGGIIDSATSTAEPALGTGRA